MYLKRKDIDKLKSALRHFVLTTAGIWVVSPDANVQALLVGAVAGIVGPAIRGIDKNDPAFGKIADGVTEAVVKKMKAKKK